jgi:hypothetical protein
MSIDSRLTRLRALVDQLERLPASTRRQWMLSEARARLVDVETGETPRAMRPLAEDPPPDSAEQPAAKRSVALRSRQPKPAGETPADLPRIDSDASANRGAAPRASVHQAERETAFAEVLWAEDWQADVSAAAQPADGDAKSHPWRRGLRG